jgi:hypothetical protein
MAKKDPGMAASGSESAPLMSGEILASSWDRAAILIICTKQMKGISAK